VKGSADSADRPSVYLLAGGGSGGHILPAVAIGERLLQLDAGAAIHFVGTRRGLETKIIPELGYPLHFIAVRGFARGRIIANLAVPLRLLWSLAQCAALLRRLRPEVVVGTGGYVSGPMLFVAALGGFPTLIQEQNSCPGVTTRLLARMVDRIHLGFEESKKYFGNQKKLYVTGNPVRKMVMIDREVARTKFGLASGKPTLLVFGGSQGARVINSTMVSLLDRLMTETEIQILWSCGKWNYDEVKGATARYPGRVWVVDFIVEMAMAYSAAEVVVCRAGAMTLAEINKFGLAAILIPFAAAAANHQQANALALQERGSALVITEKELTPQTLADAIIALVRDPGRRRSMQAAALRADFTDATDSIARSVLALKKTG